MWFLKSKLHRNYLTCSTHLILSISNVFSMEHGTIKEKMSCYHLFHSCKKSLTSIHFLATFSEISAKKHGKFYFVHIYSILCVVNHPIPCPFCYCFTYHFNNREQINECWCVWWCILFWLFRCEVFSRSNWNILNNAFFHCSNWRSGWSCW